MFDTTHHIRIREFSELRTTDLNLHLLTILNRALQANGNPSTIAKLPCVETAVPFPPRLARTYFQVAVTNCSQTTVSIELPKTGIRTFDNRSALASNCSYDLAAFVQLLLNILCSPPAVSVSLWNPSAKRSYIALHGSGLQCWD